MSAVRIVPGQYARRHADEPTARLAGTLLSVAAAGLVEPGRLRRGRQYLADDAVLELVLDHRRLGATVVGSASTPYHVEISVQAVGRPADLTGTPQRHHFAHLAPRADELLTSCTCPDGDLPCKHVAAVLLAFADEVSHQPDLLVRWRCAEPGAAVQRARAGSRTRFDSYTPPTTTPPPAPFATPEWQQYLQAPSPTEPAPGVNAAPDHPLGHEPFGTVDLAVWVAEARQAIVSPAASRTREWD